MRWGMKKAAVKATEIDLAWRRSLRAAVAGDWLAAETWLERIVEADSQNLEAYLVLARLYRSQGAIGRALRMHQNLLLRSGLQESTRKEALLELARDFEEGGYQARAAAAYEELLDSQPRNAKILERLASVLHDLSEFPRALTMARRLRRRDRKIGTRLEVRILLAQAESQNASGDHDGARQSIKQCLRRDKECAMAWLRLGELEAERGRESKALDAWKRGATADAVVAETLYPKLAATFAACGKPGEFDRFLLKLLDARPKDHGARIALARARSSRGDTSAAIEELARAIEVTPDHLGLRCELGRLLISSGQDAEALKAYGDLLSVVERTTAVTDAGGSETDG